MQNFRKICWKLFEKIPKTTFFCFIVARDEKLKVSRRRGALPPPKIFLLPPGDHLAATAKLCLPASGATISTKCRRPALLRSVCLNKLVLLPVPHWTRSATLRSAPTECKDSWAVNAILSQILSVATQKKHHFQLKTLIVSHTKQILPEILAKTNS